MNGLLIFSVVIFTGLFFDRFDIFKIYLLSTFLHEAGHIVSHRFFAKHWPYIDVSLFGYRMKNNVIHNKYYIFILLRGPFTNLFVASAAYFLLCFEATFAGYIWFSVNIIIFFFNILPVYFLDGGQVLYHLSPFYQQKCIKISCITVLVLCVMVYCFTGVLLPVLIFAAYFVINVLNDI